MTDSGKFLAASTTTRLRAVLFRSEERFEAFKKKLAECYIDTTVLDFEGNDWIDFDYGQADILIYYPSFQFSSNHPLSLDAVKDNLRFISERYPNLRMYPDPGVVPYYNDKYRQFLFLKSSGFPIPETIPLCSESSVSLAEDKLGYPMVIKNRYGAGGDTVFRISTRSELNKYYRLSRLNLFNLDSLGYFLKMLSRRIFYYHLIKEKKMSYPFMSPPLLAQKFIKLDRDLKTVVGNFRVVEGHWRIKANEAMWKVNIDGGGIGEWSRIPQEATDLSERLARELNASWLNIDLIPSDQGFLITEFSPVWHHYRFREKPSFVYRDDYNIDIPLETSLDLETMIVDSLSALSTPRT